MTRVFVASNMPTAYPYKLQKPSTVTPSVRETAECFIMDSGIGDDISNAEVLDLAHDNSADYVVAKDYLHEQDKTTESVREFFELYESHPCEAAPMVPLQPPHHEHYPDLEGFDHYVLGGMVDQEIKTRQRVRWIEQFNEVVPDDVYVHALGVGGSLRFVESIAGRGLVDSVDCSTPEQASMFGQVIDDQLKSSETMAFPGGEGRRDRTVPLAEYNSWQVRDVWEREANQNAKNTLEAW